MKTTFAIAGVCLLFSLLSMVHSDCLDSEGVKHADGSGPYIGRDGCNTCSCHHDMEVCTRMYCMPGHRRCMGENGTIHNEGDTFKSPDGCNTCTCTGHGVACTDMACALTTTGIDGCLDPTTRETHPVGSYYPSSDGCNKCFCQAGGIEICTERACAVVG